MPKDTQNHENLLYLITNTTDTDVLRAIDMKLQKRVKTGAVIKVKTHGGDPLHEDADISVEMGRMKEEKEKTWSVPISRTIYQWSEVSETKAGTLITKQSVWTHEVRNRMK
jgi:hypothetical protein